MEAATQKLDPTEIWSNLMEANPLDESIGAYRKGWACIRVPGMPVPWSRAGRGKQGHSYTPAKQAVQMDLVRLAWEREDLPMLTGPMVLSCQFWFPRPKSHWSSEGGLRARYRDLRPTGKPDLSNLIKLVEDSLNKVAYADDAAIVAYSACQKLYSSEARSMIQIWSVSDQDQP